MSNIQKTIEIPIKIGEVERKYIVKFPTAGQYIQMEARKAQLAVPKLSLFDSSTQYLNLIKQGTISSNMALDLIDLIASFEVCIPELMKDFVGNIEGIEDLNLFDAKLLLDVYKKYFQPWKDAWEKVFQGINENKEEKKEESK